MVMSEDKSGNKVMKLSTVVALFAITIALGCLVAAGSSQKSFVNQFSFASTITSIVLSVIAIWLSISGDRASNELKDKVIGATIRLEQVTQNIENIDRRYEVQIKDQLDALENVNKKLDGLGGDITEVKTQLFNTKELNKIAINNKDDSNTLADSELLNIYTESLFLWDDEGKQVEYNILRELISIIKSGTDITLLTLKSIINELDCNDLTKGVYYGRLLFLIRIGLFKGENLGILQKYLEENIK